MKKKQMQQQQRKSNTIKVVVPYATETTTISYKQIEWSR